MGHLGRAYDPAREQHPLETDDHPFEDFEDGCPGGDQRCRFVLTLLAFGYRRRDANANRVSHPRFDRCTNDLVIDALMFFEMHEDRNDAECDRVRSDHLRKKADRGG